MPRNLFFSSLPLIAFALTGCSGSSSSSSGSNNPPVISPAVTLSATSLAFTATTAGTTTVASSITLTNTGTVTLNSLAIALAGTNTSDFAIVTSSLPCGSSLAAGASCIIAATFKAAALNTSYMASISITDNAPNSPQAISLSGCAGTCSPISFSPTSLTFATTTTGTATAASSTTLTNTGGAALTISSITLGGTNASDFALTTSSSPCSTTTPLAIGASCIISATFTAPSLATFSATINVTDSATGSPQSIPLTGTASASSGISYTFLVFPESDNTVTPLYNFVDKATKTLDMTMYEMQDTVMTSHLTALCTKGVRVRVIFSSSIASSSSTAYSALNSAGSNCSAVDSNSAFTNTHQKTITIDGALPTAQTAILSLNLQTQYYSTTRDFGMIENDPADIAAIEATFNQDYAVGGTNSSTEFNYQPPAGTDLIWSPTTAQTDMLGLITGAKKTLLIENEEMSAGNIVGALETACQNGVTVNITMVDSSTSAPYSDYATNFKALEAAGCGVHVYPDTTTGLYIHAKAVVADYGLSTQNVYMGSINYSTASMTKNRELGLYITDPASIQLLYATMTSDYAGASAF